MSLPPFEMITADAATTEWLRRSDRARILVLLAFLSLTVLLSVGRERQELAVFVTFGLWLAAAVSAERVLRRRRNGDRLRAVLLAADVAWVTLMLYETGVAARSGVAAYLFIIAIAAGALSGRATSALTGWAVVAYGGLLLGESAPYVRPWFFGEVAAVLRAPSQRLAAWVLGSAALIAFAYLMRTLVQLLARGEAGHRLLFWASPRPMYIYDAENLRFLAVNDAAIREYGYTRDELLGLTVADVSEPEESSPPTGPTPPALTTASPVPSPPPAASAPHRAETGPPPHKHAGTWRHKRRDGSLLDVELTSHPISVAERDARLVIITDVTDRTRLEARLRHTQRLEALGRLAGGVAHEFNNLLAAVLGHAELLAASLTEEETEGREHVDEIMNAARRGAGLTRHMLAFGRRQLLRPEVVDVSSVVRDMERLLRPLLGADVRVTLGLPAPCWARVDRSQLELVIMNLAMNGRDAMPNGGSLSLQAALVDLGPADRQRHPNVALSPGRFVRLSVSDSGGGIAPEVRERIFEPFFTTKPVGKGTGLGLSTVYGVVKQSDGYIWVYSEIGQGTSMHVYLPSVAAPDPAENGERRTSSGTSTVVSHDGAGRRHSPKSGTHRSPREGATGDSAGRGRPTASGGRVLTVLVADDEPALRTTAARVLRDAGYRVVDAESGEQALALAADGAIDILLTDVVMPGIGGVALAERVQVSHPQVRVVYMSGFPQNHLISSGKLRGGHAFVEKPFTAEGLRVAVAKVAKS